MSRASRAEHRRGGIYRLFESATFYECFQRVLGSDAARHRIVRDFVRPQPGARILDIGCGTAALLEYLPEDVTYVGYDFNPRYIDAARKRHGSRGTFFCSRLDEAPRPPEAFDIVLAIAILHHLSDDDASTLLRSARDHLGDGGTLVTLDPVRHQRQSGIARVLVALDRGRQVRTPSAYEQLARAHFAHVESTLLTDLIPIPYSHFIMRAAKTARTRSDGTRPEEPRPIWSR